MTVLVGVLAVCSVPWWVLRMIRGKRESAAGGGEAGGRAAGRAGRLLGASAGAARIVTREAPPGRLGRASQDTL